MLVVWNGQDLHLSSGAIPSIRVDGEIRRMDIPALKASDVESMVQEILTPEQKRIFQENLELDFAFV